MALRLILVRHAETDWNREGRYQGWKDVPLSETGRAQAAAAARLLASERLSAVWSSPFRRAYDTATAIAAPHRLEVRVDDGFREMGFGDWEGRTRAELAATAPEPYQVWRDTPHLAAMPGAETLGDVKKRVLGGLEDLREAHDGHTICLVTHGIVSRILILEALGLELDRLWSVHVAATGISELEFREDWTALHRMNSLVHLDLLPELG